MNRYRRQREMVRLLRDLCEGRICRAEYDRCLLDLEVGQEQLPLGPVEHGAGEQRRSAA